MHKKILVILCNHVGSSHGENVTLLTCELNSDNLMCLTALAPPCPPKCASHLPSLHYKNSAWRQWCVAKTIWLVHTTQPSEALCINCQGSVRSVQRSTHPAVVQDRPLSSLLIKTAVYQSAMFCHFLLSLSALRVPVASFRFHRRSSCGFKPTNQYSDQNDNCRILLVCFIYLFIYLFRPRSTILWYFSSQSREPTGPPCNGNSKS